MSVQGRGVEGSGCVCRGGEWCECAGEGSGCECAGEGRGGEWV